MTATTLEEKLDPPLLFPGLTWEQFKTLEPMLDIPGVRLSFLDGILEIEKIDGPILKVDCVFQGKTEFPDWYKELESKEDEDA